MRYAEYFPEYAQYFGRSLKLLKSMYGMTNCSKLFADELTEWIIEEGFIQSQCQMSIYYKYAPDGSKIVGLSYVDDCVYWYPNGISFPRYQQTISKIFICIPVDTIINIR